MGRTWRKRNKNKSQSRNGSLEEDPNIIQLKISLKKAMWNNIAQLQIKDFKQTGRGVCSKQNINTEETLIEVPFKAMISLHTINDVAEIINGKLTMHDLLAIFLIIEKHKGASSNWAHYINSLPSEAPSLPWLCTAEETSLLPEEFAQELLKRKRCFETSWERVKKSIRLDVDCVIDMHSFTWGYIMVNTRAVYVDPDIVLTQSDNSLRHLLSDDPNMALCPYLDMFNHSDGANTRADLQRTNGGCMYKLTTLTPYNKYDQIFISYGAHDNVKLLCEYGFYIPYNAFDIFRLNFEVLARLVKFNKTQYRYVKEKQLDEKLHISMNGLSFNLRAVLFVALHDELNDWSCNIYSENYSERDLFSMLDLAIKIAEIESCIVPITHENSSPYFKIAIEYLQYVSVYRQSVIKHLFCEMNKYDVT